MGKNTYFSIPKNNRPLKNRLNIVLTNDKNLHNNNDNNLIFTNNNNIYQDILQQKDHYLKMFEYLNNDFKIFFIGGKTIYEQFLPLCNKIWITYIKYDYDCDLFFDYDYSKKFISKIHDDNEELKIVEYIKI
jgi:dihydrofolate reductase